MRREEDKLEKRARYVAAEIMNRPKSVARIVSELADELFLSERTIWNDYEKAVKKGEFSASTATRHKY
jgi:predicted transcriptional regulator